MKKFALFALSAAALLSGCVETEEPGGGEIVVKAAFSTDREFYVAGDEVLPMKPQWKTLPYLVMNGISA